MLSDLSPVLLCFVFLNSLFILFYKKIAKIINLFDYPNVDRKLHKSPVPLLGGTLFIINLFVLVSIIFLNYKTDFLLISLFQTWDKTLIFFTILFLFSILGFCDDKYNLKATNKIVFSIIILFLIIMLPELKITFLKFSFLSFNLELGLFSLPFTILCFLLIINALNMFDGINYQFGIFSLIAILFLLLNGFNVLLCLIIIIYLTSFLLLNHNSKVFMGDNGTIPFAVLLGSLIIEAYNSQIILYSDYIFILLCIPGFDLLRLSILRFKKHGNMFLPDNNHIHHLLITRFSIYHSNIIIALMTIIPVFLVSNVFFKFHSLIIIVAIASIYLYLIVCLTRS